MDPRRNANKQDQRYANDSPEIDTTTGEIEEDPTKTGTGNIILQVIAGVAIAAFIYWMSLFAIKRDRLVIKSQKAATNKPTAFPIMNGYIDCLSGMNVTFNTNNEDSKNFLALPRSVNRKGGAQFSYTYWMYMENTEPDNVAGKVLFCRGDPAQYMYQLLSDEGKVLESGSDRIVKCPLVRFGNSYKELIVEFNTNDRFNEKMVIMNNISEGDSAVRRNVMSLTPRYWVLLSFIFEDNVPINDFENGIAIRFYVNDTLYQLHKVKSSLRQNVGDLTLLPARGTAGITDARIADLTYHNYALDDTDIKNIYTRGPSKNRYTPRNASFGSALYLSAANRTDQSNL
jgi:hypothetical protein